MLISKMCYKGKCLYCIPVEKGCLVIAIIIAIANAVALLASIILGILIAADIIFVQNSHEDIHNLGQVFGAMVLGMIWLAAGFLCILVGVGSLIAFIFSVLLCHGICNRRPGPVKAYFVYGIVITVLTVIASVFDLATGEDPVFGIVGLLACVIYSLFLVLVQQTYTKLCADAEFKDHIQLVEDA